MKRALVDNDVLLKAAHWQLLDQIPSCAGVGWEQVFVLESLRFRTQRKDKKLFRDPKVATELVKRLVLTGEMPGFDSEVAAALQGVIGLDAGEVILIAILCGCSDSVLITGDKRAIRALAAPELTVIAERVRGRIICLEQVLSHALDVDGARAVSRRIAPFRELDTAIKCIIGSSDMFDEHLIRSGLHSYLQDIERDAPGLLMEGLGLQRLKPQ